jgi:sporulation protein YlmC with PRC-barrel domain
MNGFTPHDAEAEAAPLRESAKCITAAAGRRQIPMKTHTLLPSPTSPASDGKTWLASRLLQRQVVNASTIEPVGRVADVVFDPESCQLTELIIQSTSSESRLMTAIRRAYNHHAYNRSHPVASIPVDHIIALNGDVVMVDCDPIISALLRSNTSAAYLGDVCELTILTFHGICLGTLADLLLDSQGRTVIGYVVNATKQAELILEPPTALALPSSLETQPEMGTPADASAATPSEVKSLLTHQRVIPASPRVRIGEELILVMAGVEPLGQSPL